MSQTESINDVYGYTTDTPRKDKKGRVIGMRIGGTIINKVRPARRLRKWVGHRAMKRAQVKARKALNNVQLWRLRRQNYLDRLRGLRSRTITALLVAEREQLVKATAPEKQKYLQLDQVVMFTAAEHNRKDRRAFLSAARSARHHAHNAGDPATSHVAPTYKTRVPKHRGR